MSTFNNLIKAIAEKSNINPQKSNKNTDNFYSIRKQFYLEDYLKHENDSELFWPNGFKEFPIEIYDAFSQEITGDGKILDLGCGNGLMMKYVIHQTGYNLIPFGIDFCEPSVEQAKKLVLPEFKDNFTVGNLVEYTFKDAPYKYIFLNPSHVESTDFAHLIDKIIHACSPGGKIIIYLYDDHITANNLNWVGELPQLSGLKLERKDIPHLSMGIYTKV